jgi:hypothetical protein
MLFWRQVTMPFVGCCIETSETGKSMMRVQHYFEEMTAACRERGLSDEDGRRAARQECGNLTQPVCTYGWENTVRIFVADF